MPRRPSQAHDRPAFLFAARSDFSTEPLVHDCGSHRTAALCLVRGRGPSSFSIDVGSVGHEQTPAPARWTPRICHHVHLQLGDRTERPTGRDRANLDGLVRRHRTWSGRRQPGRPSPEASKAEDVGSALTIRGRTASTRKQPAFRRRVPSREGAQVFTSTNMGPSAVRLLGPLSISGGRHTTPIMHALLTHPLWRSTCACGGGGGGRASILSVRIPSCAGMLGLASPRETFDGQPSELVGASDSGVSGDEQRKGGASSIIALE